MPQMPTEIFVTLCYTVLSWLLVNSIPPPPPSTPQWRRRAEEEDVLRATEGPQEALCPCSSPVGMPVKPPAQPKNQHPAGKQDALPRRHPQSIYTSLMEPMSIQNVGSLTAFILGFGS